MKTEAALVVGATALVVAGGIYLALTMPAEAEEEEEEEVEEGLQLAGTGEFTIDIE
ncbi:hypothetical protein LCGC14_2148750 [marine sediment metagenome]|uniref:Uncharacterized protein n=1 Tax=marine sediment metagenome TaxID=412755 RepID=A0A0F9DW16_9ZZZZ